MASHPPPTCTEPADWTALLAVLFRIESAKESAKDVMTQYTGYFDFCV
jgi:hypothetical protein